MRKTSFLIALISLLSVTSSFTPDVNPAYKQDSSFCTVGVFLKHQYSGTIHAIGWRDEDESYSATNLVYGDYFSSSFTSPGSLIISLKLPASHPTGSMSVINAATGTILYCVNITASQTFYTYTVTSPGCGDNYVVQVDDNPC